MEPSEEDLKRLAAYARQQPYSVSPEFRIGQLEGIIMGAIQHLESVQNALNKPQSWLVPQAARDNEQVIANLKQLIGEKP